MNEPLRPVGPSIKFIMKAYLPATAQDFPLIQLSEFSLPPLLLPDFDDLVPVGRRRRRHA